MPGLLALGPQRCPATGRLPDPANSVIFLDLMYRPSSQRCWAPRGWEVAGGLARLPTLPWAPGVSPDTGRLSQKTWAPAPLPLASQFLPSLRSAFGVGAVTQ